MRQPIWGWFVAAGPVRHGAGATTRRPAIAKFMTGTPTILGTAAVEESVAAAGSRPASGRCGPRASQLTELADRAGRRVAGPAGLRAGHATRPRPPRRPRHLPAPAGRADRRAARGREHHRRLPHAGAVPAGHVPAVHAFHRCVDRRWHRAGHHREQTAEAAMTERVTYSSYLRLVDQQLTDRPPTRRPSTTRSSSSSCTRSTSSGSSCCCTSSAARDHARRGRAPRRQLKRGGRRRSRAFSSTSYACWRR